MHNDATTNSGGERLDPVAHPSIEPYPHEVLITANGVTLAHTKRGQLLRETYAPDIYIPATNVRLELLSRSETETFCPYKTCIATHYHAIAAGKQIQDIAWRYCEPLGQPKLRGHYAFYFDKVCTEVDGRLVRGHVRDPHKIISVTPVDTNLCLEIAGHVIADTDQALLLHETGLPSRYYIPPDDIDASCLVTSDRRSVCTYKGEATYHHLKVGDCLIENAVWTYADAWTDFSADVGNIQGYRGFYASTFDRVLLNQVVVSDDTNDAAADRAMIARPTIDRVVREKAASSTKA